MMINEMSLRATTGRRGEEVTMDLSFNFGSFESTTVKVEALSPKGREFLGTMFGDACIGVTIPKSKGGDLSAYATRKGCSVGGSHALG